MDNNVQNGIQVTDAGVLDIRKYISTLLNKAWQICLTTILCGIIGFAGSVMLLTPEYQD